MKMLLILAVLSACQPPVDTTSATVADATDSKIYFRAALGDLGVKLDKKWDFDPGIPAKIHALFPAYQPLDNQRLDATTVTSAHVVAFKSAIFSWHHKGKPDRIFTCHLHELHLGEKRGLFSSGTDNCYQQKRKDNKGDYIHQLAAYCSSSRKGEFIRLAGKDFACDLSEIDNSKLVLHASCFADDSAEKCLGGEVLRCAEQESFDEFIKTFKERVDSKCADGESCLPGYDWKDGGKPLCEIAQPAQAEKDEEQATQSRDQPPGSSGGQEDDNGGDNDQ